jgi:hypothetical protein
MMVTRISWDKAGRVEEAGRYMLSFGSVTVTHDDLDIRRRFSGCNFLRFCELSRSESNECRRASLEFNTLTFDADATRD